MTVSEDKPEQAVERKLKQALAAAQKARQENKVKNGSLDEFAISGFPKRPAKLFW